MCVACVCERERERERVFVQTECMKESTNRMYETECFFFVSSALFLENSNNEERGKLRE